MRFDHCSTTRSVVLALLLMVGGLWCSMPSKCQIVASADTQRPLKELSLEELSNIEVTTLSKEPQRITETAAAVFVITGDAICRSGATSLPEVLRLAPGVEVARISSDKWSVGIRGFGSRLARAVLVLIDGRTVYTTLLAGTYWEVQNVVLEDVDRIEVIRGPGGTIWGPNSFNGVINIITKKAKDTHGTLVSATAGNVDQGMLNFRYGGGGKDGKLDYRVYGMWFTRNHEFHPDHQNYDDWRAGQGGFRVDYARNDRDAFTFQGDLYKMLAGETVNAVSYTPPFSTFPAENAHLSGGNVQARWTRTYDAGNDFQFQFYYDRANRHEPNFADIRDTFDLDYVQHHRSFWRQSLTWGLGARFSHGNDIQVVSGLTFLPAQRTDRLLTAFLQDEIALIEHKLTLTIGSKFLNTNFEAFKPEPSARLLWSPTANTSIWVAATHAVRTPSDAERDFFLSGFLGLTPTGTPIFARFNANRDFHSEQLNGYELGVRQMLGKKVFVDVSSFYNHYNNLFSEDITGGFAPEDTPAPPHILLPARFGNGLLGNTRGVEIAPEWRPMSFWRLRAAYSYLKMSVEKAPNSLDIGSAKSVVGSSPNHQLYVTSSWDMTTRFSLDLSYRYVSNLTTGNIPSYQTGDARFAWHPNSALEISLVGRNLFQPYHFEFPSDPGPNVGIRRSGYAQITWTR
jgi:iron complex outermembrane recepter protein